MIIRTENENVAKYKNFCMRLMRNLGHYSYDPQFYMFTQGRCNILFNWIYKSIDEQKITNNIINKCFDMYDFEMKKKQNDKKCHYFRDIKIYEPINIILLDVFNGEISTIETALMNENSYISNNSRNFICECVKIYKRMNDLYCINGRGKKDDYNSTCLKLEEFKNTYTLFHFNKGHLNLNIPSLDDKEFLDKCPSDKMNTALIPMELEKVDRPLEGEFQSVPEGPRSTSSVELPASLGTLEIQLRRV
ncbi:hypothetical protein PVIIG_05916 [Plasmodium vivax India VII]|uniref:Variable surface protein n=1 Tax=Plasmodium vivax India VII TaxID=1077284 RepID=A0A0J9S1F5_PLAVI|nr:hypothetical protein PVIIG_05916 [Plasmodium vivax India VII]